MWNVNFFVNKWFFFSKCTALGKNGEHGCISDEGDPLIWEDIGKLEFGLYRAYLIGIAAQQYDCMKSIV